MSVRSEQFWSASGYNTVLLAAYQLLQCVWVSFKNSILLVGNLSLHSNTPWSRPHWRDACCLESEEECLSTVPAAWTPLSGAWSVCMSGQEGETDPLNSLELAHSQESVTWVSQPESTSRDCLTLYRCLMVAFPSCTQPAVKRLLTKRCLKKDCCCLSVQPSGLHVDFNPLIQGVKLPVEQTFSWHGAACTIP